MNLKKILYIVTLGIFLYVFLFYISTYKSKYEPTAYFTTWGIENLNYNYNLRDLNKMLKNAGFITVPYPPKKLQKNDLNIVVWKEFSLPSLNQKNQSYLWLLESPISAKIPPTEEYKINFNKIFTWHKASADGKKIFYVPIPYDYNRVLKKHHIKSKEYLVSQVAQNIKYADPLRVESIIWFLENHPEDIRFFGNDWWNIYSELSEKAKKEFTKRYGGYVENKIAEIEKAKFVLAYENIRFEDYVSEKIYDAMAAGSVPIYSGAPNITDYVPKECFIDFYAFNNHEELYQYIKNMSDKKYNEYMSCISDFMKEPERHENYPPKVAKKIFDLIFVRM